MKACPLNYPCKKTAYYFNSILTHNRDGPHRNALHIHITSLICTVESHHGHSRALSIFCSVCFLRVWLLCCDWVMQCFIWHSSCYVMSNIAPFICDLLAKPAGRPYLFLCSHHTEELACYVKRTKKMLFPREKSFSPFALVGRKKKYLIGKKLG